MEVPSLGWCALVPVLVVRPGPQAPTGLQAANCTGKCHWQCWRWQCGQCHVQCATASARLGSCRLAGPGGTGSLSAPPRRVPERPRGLPMAKFERASVWPRRRRHIMSPSHRGRPAGPRATPENCRPQWPKGCAHGAGRPGPRLLHARLTEAPSPRVINGAPSEAASGSAPRPPPERRGGQWQPTSKRGERAAAGREQPEPDSGDFRKSPLIHSRTQKTWTRSRRRWPTWSTGSRSS
jgi:hypothetical protein